MIKYNYIRGFILLQIEKNYKPISIANTTSKNHYTSRIFKQQRISLKALNTPLFVKILKMIKNYPQIKIFTYFKGSISTMYYKIIIINNIYSTKKNILALSPFYYIYFFPWTTKKPCKSPPTRLIEKLREPDLNRRPSGYEPDEWNI